MLTVMAESTAGKRGRGHSNNSSSDDGEGSLKPLRKIRGRSGYNVWHAEFSKTTGTFVHYP